MNPAPHDLRGSVLGNYYCDENLHGERKLLVRVNLEIDLCLEPGRWCGDPVASTQVLCDAVAREITALRSTAPAGNWVKPLLRDRRVAAAVGFTPLRDWTRELQAAAQKQGWDIFWAQHDTYTQFELQALNEMPDDSDPPFSGEHCDARVANYVQVQASSGDTTCRRAIEFLIAVGSTDVHAYDLQKTW